MLILYLKLTYLLKCMMQRYGLIRQSIIIWYIVGQMKALLNFCYYHRTKTNKAKIQYWQLYGWATMFDKKIYSVLLVFGLHFCCLCFYPRLSSSSDLRSLMSLILFVCRMFYKKSFSSCVFRLFYSSIILGLHLSCDSNFRWYTAFYLSTEC